VLATTAAAALAKTAGVDLTVDGEPIPTSGVAVVTAFACALGAALAAALRRWSSRPRARFTTAAVVLTALSLVPPLLVEAAAGTRATLVGLHLLAAAIAVPALARGADHPATSPQSANYTPRQV
jgi:hypothetical protein